MATIEDLRASITSMSEKELIDLLRDIRASRRVTKDFRKSSKKSAKAKAETLFNPANLTEDVAKKILELLGEQDETSNS